MIFNLVHAGGCTDQCARFAALMGHPSAEQIEGALGSGVMSAARNITTQRRTEGAPSTMRVDEIVISFRHALDCSCLGCKPSKAVAK